MRGVDGKLRPPIVPLPRELRSQTISMRERPLDAFVARPLVDPDLHANRPGVLPRARVDDDGVDALARRAVAGDVAAVGSLYDELVGPIYRYVALRVQRREDAE